LKSEDLETKVKSLKDTVKKLEARVQVNEDIEAINNYERHGYYLEHWQEDQIIDCGSP